MFCLVPTSSFIYLFFYLGPFGQFVFLSGVNQLLWASVQVISISFGVISLDLVSKVKLEGQGSG